MKASCKFFYDALCDYIDQLLPRAVMDEIEAHLDLCENCMIYIKTYKKSIELLGKAPPIEMPEELKQILLKALRES